MCDNSQNMIKEIELIQKCIDRMSNASLVIKGWSITLFTVILTVMLEKVNTSFFCLVCIISSCCFWYIDTCFLKVEKLYRLKYEWVIANRETSNEYLFDINPYNEQMRMNDLDGFPQKSKNILRLMLSKTIAPIYLSMIMLTILYLIYQTLFCC